MQRWGVSGAATLIGVAIAGMVAAAPAAPAAAAPQVEAALTRFLSASHADPAWFSPAFLAQVPIAKIDAGFAPLREAVGTLRAVVVDGDGYRADCARGSIPIVARLDDQGRFTTLFLKTPELAPTTLAEAVKRFSSLPGRVSLLALIDGQVRAELAPDDPLAVGSAFKLAVLAALREQIAAGQMSWAQVVALDDRWKSLPSGVLQTWPTGSHLTIETLAAAMISISDNTATDALIALLGRDTVERKLPARARPLLTTREAFVLKASENADLLARYRASKPAARRLILPDADRRALPRGLDFATPTALDVEWNLSARELCGLMREVADLPLMTINPGIGEARPGERIAFKGGSEPGVLNLTVQVTRAGHQACVAATWNDPKNEVDATKLVVAVRGLLSTLLSP